MEKSENVDTVDCKPGSKWSLRASISSSSNTLLEDETHSENSAFSDGNIHLLTKRHDWDVAFALGMQVGYNLILA